MKKNFKENEELDIIVLIEKIKLMLLSLFLQIFRRSKSFLLGWKKATNDDDIFHVSKDDEHDA